MRNAQVLTSPPQKWGITNSSSSFHFGGKFLCDTFIETDGWACRHCWINLYMYVYFSNQIAVVVLALSFFFFCIETTRELVGKMVKCVRKHKRMFFCFDSEPHGWSVAMLDLDRDSFFSLKKKKCTYTYGCCVCTRWQNKEKVFISWEKETILVHCVCVCMEKKKALLEPLSYCCRVDIPRQFSSSLGQRKTENG